MEANRSACGIRSCLACEGEMLRYDALCVCEYQINRYKIASGRRRRVPSGPPRGLATKWQLKPKVDFAGVVQWQNGSFPSCIRGFDSLRPLQYPCGTGISAQGKILK